MWVRDQKAVGVILAEARKRSGLSQTEVARRLSKPQSFVSNYEKGQRRVDVLELIRIANAIEADSKAIFAQIVARIGGQQRKRAGASR